MSNWRKDNHGVWPPAPPVPVPGEGEHLPGTNPDPVKPRLREQICFECQGASSLKPTCPRCRGAGKIIIKYVP